MSQPGREWEKTVTFSHKVYHQIQLDGSVTGKRKFGLHTTFRSVLYQQHFRRQVIENDLNITLHFDSFCKYSRVNELLSTKCSPGLAACCDSLECILTPRIDQK